jgi:hypothetical protein
VTTEQGGLIPNPAIKGPKPINGKPLVIDFDPSKLSRHFEIKLTDGQLVAGNPARLIYVTENYLTPRYTISGAKAAEAVYGLGQPYNHEAFQDLVGETNEILTDYDQKILSRTATNSRSFADRIRYYRMRLVDPRIPHPIRPQHLAGLTALCTDPSTTKEDLVAILGPKENGEPYIPNRAVGSYISSVMRLYSRVTETGFRAATASDQERELWNLLRETFAQTNAAKLDNYQFGRMLRSRFWQLYRGDIPSFIPDERVAALRQSAQAEQDKIGVKEQMEQQLKKQFGKNLEWVTEPQYQVLWAIYFAPNMRTSITDLVEAVYGGRYDRGSDTVRNDEGRIVIEYPKDSVRSVIRSLNKTHLARLGTQIKSVPLAKSEQPSNEWSFNEGRYTFVPPLSQGGSSAKNKRA